MIATFTDTTQASYVLEDRLLFPTEIRVLRWKETPRGFNERLVNVCKALRNGKFKDLRFFNYNLWGEEAAELLQLKNMFTVGMTSYIDTYLKPEIKQNFDFDMHAWIRMDKPNSVTPPHNHPAASLVATYYCAAEIGARKTDVPGYEVNISDGDLLLLDPRPTVQPVRYFKAGNIVAISPEVGMMVVMPGYLMHWTNPVSEGDSRICIANNMNLIPKNSLGKKESF